MKSQTDSGIEKDIKWYGDRLAPNTRNARSRLCPPNLELELAITCNRVNYSAGISGGRILSGRLELLESCITKIGVRPESNDIMRVPIHVTEKVQYSEHV